MDEENLRKTVIKFLTFYYTILITTQIYMYIWVL